MTDVAGRTAFITGGANGIGLGIARALAGAGAKIALVDLDESALDAAKDELSKTAEVFAAKLDVRDRDAYAEVAREVELALGCVSILVNNAGVAGGASLDKLNYELWDWGVDINFNGVFNGVRNFVPGMMQREEGGHVVNTASSAGLVANASGVLYHATKFGVVGMSEAMQIELAPHGIGVTVLCPGPVATGIVERTRASQPKISREMSRAQLRAAFEKHDAMKQFLEQGASPDDVGQMVVEAVKTNQLHLHTCASVKDLVVTRHKAIMDAMPA
ncbi:SDR family oxidoreductase [Kineobactrum salinum]|uniref:SDR family oxidoreductase n=1 Tax=Kineobactrum salinum TaxID=2708301 RepID=A0A6C0U206_9GAMM|nr:SDR family oxidoreductase [Kineobactrum salinum]QIB65509.1 SDR family oxidoreductase [Kineobactrum salinum]